MSIEAMKRLVAAFDAPDGMPELCKAIDDMRQAIERAERQSTHSEDCYKWHHACAIARIEQAEKQEPFAYAYTGIKQSGEHHGPHLIWKPVYMDAMSASIGAVAVPLYTAQPQRQTLTDVPEIARRVMRFAGKTMRTSRNPNITARECIELANWLAAHGIKENT